MASLEVRGFGGLGRSLRLGWVFFGFVCRVFVVILFWSWLQFLLVFERCGRQGENHGKGGFPLQILLLLLLLIIERSRM